MRDLCQGRDAVDQRHLVAPVELVRLARREAQRHEGRRRRRVLPPRPGRRKAPHCVVAAPVAEAPQLLEYPHQRQPLPPRPRCVPREDPIELLPPSPDLRLRLDAPLVFEGVSSRRMILRTVFRETCSSRTISLMLLPRTKYSRRTRAIVSTPFIPRPPVLVHGRGVFTVRVKGGQFWTPIPPLRGSTFHADTAEDVFFWYVVAEPVGESSRKEYQRRLNLPGKPSQADRKWKLFRVLLPKLALEDAKDRTRPGPRVT
jgi:hypothetical protein